AERAVNGARAEREAVPLGFSPEYEFRRAAAGPHHLDVAPLHPFGPAGPERLEERFLGGEADREVWVRIAMLPAVLRLGLRVDAAHEALPGSRERLAHARDVDHIDPDSDDQRCSPSLRPATRSKCLRFRVSKVPSCS